MGMCSSRNLVLICLDSVRKDFFDSVASHVLELAEVSFEQCRAASSWSAPSYASMISGSLPHQHGVHTHSQSFDSLPFNKTVFGALQDYRTVGISSNVYAGPDFGFNKYFDKFETIASHTPFPEAADPQAFQRSRDGGVVRNYISFCVRALRNPHPLRSVTNGLAGLTRKASLAGYFPRVVDDGAKGGLRTIKRELASGEEPQFLFISFMEGHIPHQPAFYLDSKYYDCPWSWSSDERDVWDLCIDGGYKDQYWIRRNQLYRATIDYLDRVIYELVEFANELTDHETTIIVTADHGENLGNETDESLANHKSSLSEGLLHVPFYLINPPEGYRSQEDRYFSHLELPSLIEGLADGQTPAVFEERIPAEVIGLSPGPDPGSNFEHWDRMIRCGYCESMKSVWDSLGEVRQYDLDAQKFNWQRYRNGKNNVPEWAAELFDVPISEYKETARNTQEMTDLDDAIKDCLGGFGYL